MPAATVDQYLSSLPERTRAVTEQVWLHVVRGVRDGEPSIAYGMPTLKVNGRSVVHVGAWKSHVSMYPLPRNDRDLELEISPYVAGKGTLKFALNKPIPFDLIERVAAALRDQLDDQV